MRIHHLAAALAAIVAGPLAAQDSDFDLPGLEAAIAEGEFGSITSVYVENSEGEVYERYFDGDPPDAKRNTRSVTKTITGALLGIAIAEGHIASLDAQVLSYFPDHDPANADPRKSAMTLRDLITMTGPLECNDWNSYSRGNEERMYLVEDWVGFFLDLPIGAPPPWEPRAEDRPFGKVYSYCTAGVFTLGRIIEIATGRELEDYAREKLFAPMGIAEPDWPFSPLGIAQGGGGMGLAPSDLAKFARLHVDGGVWEGERILPSDWVSDATRAHAKIDERADYGYLWWLYDQPKSEAENTLWMMNGSGGNKVFALPELGAVAVITTTNFRRNDAHPLSERLFVDYVMPALSDED